MKKKSKIILLTGVTSIEIISFSLQETTNGITSHVRASSEKACLYFPYLTLCLS